jgi:Mn2+/Fe2+ NRAMP family transporter
MKTFQDFQKISAGVSLVILALGFLSIGLGSLIHATGSGDSIACSAMSCVIGGWASMAVAGVFLFAAFVHWQRNSFFRVNTVP